MATESRIRVNCGCGSIYSGSDFVKAVEEALKHTDQTGHTVEFLATVRSKPEIQQAGITWRSK